MDVISTDWSIRMNDIERAIAGMADLDPLEYNLPTSPVGSIAVANCNEDLRRLAEQNGKFFAIGALLRFSDVRSDVQPDRPADLSVMDILALVEESPL